jgi:DNA-nicking Smr family endonuclease
MSKPGPKSSRRGILSEEDEDLWELVAQSLEPVRRKERVRGALEPAKPRETRQAELSQGGLHPPVKPRPIALRPPARSGAPLAGIDWRQARKLAAGRVEIEARLDLHGMRQREAHSALRRFLLACHERGLRNILVITGKGSAPHCADIWDQRDQGILKQSVPRWLAEPELRSIVVGYAPAHPRHGGEGALYLQLRRRERLKDRG